MTNKKTTKRAFISSVLALLLCASMLIGTTFAWFTDSVESGRNIIQSGNLDVELYYSVLDENGDWTEYKKVDSDTDVFGYDLWEPGYTKVAKFKVVNEGSLALKYQLTADVYSEKAGTNKAGEKFLLSEYLMYGVTEDEAVLANRETAAATVKFGSFQIKANSLEAGKAEEIGMVITMPTTVGNVANHNGTEEGIPSIEFGINLVATQQMSEYDSFGKDYDDAAWDYWDGETVEYDWYVDGNDEGVYYINTAADLAGLANIVNGTATQSDVTGVLLLLRDKSPIYKDDFSDDTIYLDTDVDLKGWMWTPIGSTSNQFKGTFDGQDYTIKNLEMTPSYVDGRGRNYGAGLFGAVGDGAAVKNLTIDSAYADMRCNIVGVVAGYAYGDTAYENITITNMDIVAVAKVGGILGMLNNTGCSITMDNCSVEGTITGAYNLGGLIGLTAKNCTFNITDCVADVEYVLQDLYNDGYYAKLNDGVWAYHYLYNGEYFTYTAVSDLYCYQVEEGGLGDDTLPKNVGDSYTPASDISVIANNADTVTGVLEDALASEETDVVVDANGANIGNLNYALSATLVPKGTTVTVKNAVVEGRSYGNGVNGTVIFENCTFTRPDGGAYSIHFDNGSGDVVFKDCTLEGWCSFGNTINSVTMERCTIGGNGTYALVRFYQNATLTNCVIDCDNANLEDVYSEGISAVYGKVTLTNCELGYCNYEMSSGATITVDGVNIAVDADSLEDALVNGGDVVLTEDVKVTENVVVNGGTLDGNGETIEDTNYDSEDSDCAITTTGGTIKNVTVTGNGSTRAIGSGSSGDYTLTENLYIDNVTIDNVLYAINGGGSSDANVYVTNSTIYGWCSYSGINSFNFTDCTLGKGNSGDGYFVVYGTTNFTNCNFEGVFDMGAREEGGEVCAAGKTITFTNCTYDGVKVTADNFVEYFYYGAGDEADFGNLMRECTIVIDGVTVENSAYVD